MTVSVVLDTSLLVGFLDDRDKWHTRAVAIHDALMTVGVTLVYLDPVINEVVSVLARRLGEQKRTQQFALHRIQSPGDVSSISGEE